MKFKLSLLALFLLLTACAQKPKLVNNTKHGGYAKGENVKISFTLSAVKTAPDSINVRVIEAKSGYTYYFRIGRESGDGSFVYAGTWDGRRPDGMWPRGGKYLVFAAADLGSLVYSDTVEIGLTD